jgi:hypothetical protein
MYINSRLKTRCRYSGDKRTSQIVAATSACHLKRASRRIIFFNARRYFVIIGRDGGGGVGAGGEIESVTHAFQPEGRSEPSNSP